MTIHVGRYRLIGGRLISRAWWCDWRPEPTTVTTFRCSIGLGWIWVALYGRERRNPARRVVNR